MKIVRVHVNHFGKLSNRTFSFDDGIVLISGENESGKTTLHTFIGAMLFGLERGRGRSSQTNTRAKYFPWHSSGSYGGVMELEKDHVRYSLIRNFDKAAHPLTLADETHGRELEASGENFQQLFSGLTPSLYQNTVSVSQLGEATNSTLAAELRNRIVNLHTSGVANLDIRQASESLKKQGKALESRMIPDAEKQGRDIDEQIRILERDIAGLGDVSGLAAMEEKKKQLEAALPQYSQRQKDLGELISRSDEKLARYHIHSLEDVDSLASRTEELRQKHDELAGHVSAMPAFLRGFLSLLMLAAGLAGFWFSASRFLARNIPAGAVFLAGSVLAFTLLIRLRRRADQSQALRGLEEELLSIANGLADTPIEKYTPAIPPELVKRLEACRQLFMAGRESKNNLDQETEDFLHSQGELKELNEQLEKIRRELWQQEKAAESMRTLEEQQEDNSRLQARNRQLREDADACRLAADTIQELSSTVFNSFDFFLEEKTSYWLKGITSGAYEAIHMDDNMTITLQQGDNRIPLSQVSAGTVAQVYLALRLGCIEFLWPDEAMPLLLDDAFALYDRERLTNTLTWLSENYGGQILIFTCHTREKSILDCSRIPYHEIQL